MCKNNYYYALSSDCNQNPPPSTQLQTGIANSGTSGFYFAPGAPVANYNPAAPKVGVRVANGCPESLVASATLASVPSLPQTQWWGMSCFPHSLIGLGPFANQDCTIIFNKTIVTVYNALGHTILAGWREQTGAHLWHFRMGAPATAPVLPTLLPAPLPWPSPTLAPSPAPALPVALASHCHPSQGIIASDKVGDNVAITYLYKRTQQVALAARATNTTFDPQSLDLPSISSLICFYHACLGFPVKQTWLDAIKAGYCDTFDGLTYSNVA